MLILFNMFKKPNLNNDKEKIFVKNNFLVHFKLKVSILGIY